VICAQPLFAVDLARKDARHAMDLANKAGASLPIMSVADENLQLLKKIRGENGPLLPSPPAHPLIFDEQGTSRPCMAQRARSMGCRLRTRRRNMYEPINALNVLCPAS
jgi:hypothetical protein